MQQQQEQEQQQESYIELKNGTRIDAVPYLSVVCLGEEHPPHKQGDAHQNQ